MIIFIYFSCSTNWYKAHKHTIFGAFGRELFLTQVLWTLFVFKQIYCWAGYCPMSRIRMHASALLGWGSSVWMTYNRIVIYNREKILMTKHNKQSMKIGKIASHSMCTIWINTAPLETTLTVIVFIHIKWSMETAIFHRNFLIFRYIRTVDFVTGYQSIFNWLQCLHLRQSYLFLSMGRCWLLSSNGMVIIVFINRLAFQLMR